MLLQPLSAKIGEVKFRKLVTKQHLGEKYTFVDEPTRAQFIKILKPKLKETQKLFSKLRSKNAVLSPFLEIGAEYASRSYLLTSNFKSQGFATDISYDSLYSASKINKNFNFKKKPRLVCCDAYNLPFKSNSFPFVFIYETLHHFPDPKPVLLEAYRVLSPGGICVIGADPISQKFQLRLWRRPNKLRFWEKLLKKTLILPFVSHIGKTETDFGIIEGGFNLKTWEDALSVFDDVEVSVTPYLTSKKTYVKRSSQGSFKVNLKTRILLTIAGGGLTAICKKASLIKQKNADLGHLLICPNCLSSSNLQVQIQKNQEAFVCKRCNTTYQSKKNVLILLENKLKTKIFQEK